MKNRIFVDSSIWVYLFLDDEGAKSKVASAYITKGAKSNQLVISCQVVNEVCRALKKKNYTEQEIRNIVEDMMGLCEVRDNTGEIILMSFELCEKYSFAYWDSQVVASALLSQCDILASEDMQDGLKIADLIIKNVMKVKVARATTNTGKVSP